MEAKHWSLELFNKSLLKQHKYRAITSMLGATDGLRCLDIGGDNGVISYLLRQRGGNWSSADLDSNSIASIRSLVETEVYQLDGALLPFADSTFDRVVIIDYLEHIPDDWRLVEELHRVLKSDGILLINVPHWKEGLLRKLQYRLGQTDEKHGHVRPGYTLASLRTLLGSRFEIEAAPTYSKFFAELTDSLIVFAMSRLKGSSTSKKGLVVTQQDMGKYKSAFRAYSLVYPVFRAAALFDQLMVFSSGYKLIVKARICKDAN